MFGYYENTEEVLLIFGHTNTLDIVLFMLAFQNINFVEDKIYSSQAADMDNWLRFEGGSNQNNSC